MSGTRIQHGLPVAASLTLDSAVVQQLRDRAIDQLRAALNSAGEGSPQRSLLSERLGELLRSAGRLEEAAQAYGQAAELDPTRERVAYLARCLRGELEDVPDAELRRLGISPFWLIDEVLEPPRLRALMERIAAGRSEFEPSLVDSGVQYTEGSDVESKTSKRPDARTSSWMRRRSLTKLDAEEWLPELQQGVFELLPKVCERLGLRPFEPRRWQLQLTAHGNGDYYRCHVDGGDRRVSCVFYCFEEPRRFSGGDLLLFDPKGALDYEPSRLTRIVPRSNSLILFDSRTAHEVMPVRTEADDFMARRFAFNGWVSS